MHFSAAAAAAAFRRFLFQLVATQKAELLQLLLLPLLTGRPAGACVTRDGDRNGAVHVSTDAHRPTASDGERRRTCRRLFLCRRH